MTKLRQLILEVMGVYLPAAKLARSMSIQLMKYLNTHRNIIINSKFNMIEMPYVFRDQYDFQLQNNIIIINYNSLKT